MFGNGPPVHHFQFLMTFGDGCRSSISGTASNGIRTSKRPIALTSMKWPDSLEHSRSFFCGPMQSHLGIGDGDVDSVSLTVTTSPQESR